MKKGIDPKALALNTIDIFTAHYYPISTGLLDADAQLASYKQKVFIVGEYDWTGTHGGDDLRSFLPDVERSNNVAGDLYWSLFAHGDTYGYDLHKMAALRNLNRS